MDNESSTDAHQTDPNSGAAMAIAFGAFTFDPASGVLLRDGRHVHVPPQAMKVLLCLLERPGAVVSKDDLIGRVWAGTAVTDASLTETVRTLRNALGDDPRRPTYLQTVHRRGYRFIAAIKPAGDQVPSDRAGPAEENLPPAGPVASTWTHAAFGGG